MACFLGGLECPIPPSTYIASYVSKDRSPNQIFVLAPAARNYPLKVNNKDIKTTFTSNVLVSLLFNMNSYFHSRKFL